MYPVGGRFVCNDYLSRCGLESVRYGVSNVLDTAYWVFLGVEITFDIFENIHILYLQYGVLVFSGYGVLIMFPSLSLENYPGGCQILGGKLVCWSAKKQNSVAISSTEAEYVAIAGCFAQHCQRAQRSEYTRFISLIIEHLLGDQYKNDEITIFNPFNIIVASFSKTPSTSEVPLTSHMQKVAKPYEPAKSLILPCGELNADRASDKSLSETAMQSSNQPKAQTRKKSRKKQNPPSFEPKTFTYVRHLKAKKKVIETQHTEKSRATADITKGLDTSKPAKEVANQPETTAIKKEPKPILADETVNITLDADLEKGTLADDVRLVSLGSIQVDKVMEDTSSNPESMSDDEIMSISDTLKN
ncbi:hypothetical protein Tco_0621758 [Tanacetum coccineum]